MHEEARRAVQVLALLLCLAFAISAAGATCIPSKEFGQVSYDYGYTYVLFPSDADATSASVLGRFWSPGGRAGANEGACVASDWLRSCDPTIRPCGGGTAGHVFYINGSLGGTTCVPAG